MPLSRRLLLQAAAASAVAAPAPRISRVEAIPLPYPVTGPFKFLTRPERPSVLVKITCEGGATGWGQSVPIPSWSYETPESALNAIERYLGPPLIGANPTDIAGAHEIMNRAIAPSFSTGMPIAKAGIDLALHDLVGRLRQQSLPERWGRKPLRKITLSWTVNTPRLPEVEQLVAQGFARGYRNFNVKLGPDPRYDIEMCRLVRKLAPEAFLWGDANGSYDLASALWVAPKLAALGMNIFEQPIPSNRLSGYRDLKKQGALPILMDEGVVSSVELVEFIRFGLLDGVAMKPARTAGLHDARKQIEILLDAGLLFLGSGLTDPDLSLAATLQLYAAYHLRFPAALNGPQFLGASYLRKPFVIEGGEIEVPEGPGLGAEIDEEKIRRL